MQTVGQPLVVPAGGCGDYLRRERREAEVIARDVGSLAHRGRQRGPDRRETALGVRQARAAAPGATFGRGGGERPVAGLQRGSAVEDLPARRQRSAQLTPAVIASRRCCGHSNLSNAVPAACSSSSRISASDLLLSSRRPEAISKPVL